MASTKAVKGAEEIDAALLDEDDEALLVRLEKEGLVRRGQGGPIPPELLLPGPKCRQSSVLDALIEQRGSER